MAVTEAWNSGWTEHAGFSGGSGNISVSPPAGLASGNAWVILLMGDIDTGGTIGIPSGFNAVSAQLLYSNLYPVGRAFIKPNCTGGESAVNVPVTSCYTVRFTSGRMIGTGTTIGTVLGNNSNTTDATDTTVAAPNITVQNNDSVVVAWFGFNGNNGATTSVATPTGLTVRAAQDTGNSYENGAVASGAHNAGTTALGNWQINTTRDNWFLQTFEILPSAGGGPFGLVQSGAIAATATLVASGNIGKVKGLTQSGSIGIAGGLDLSGDLGKNKNLVQSGNIGIAGGVLLSGDVNAVSLYWEIQTNIPPSTQVHVVVFNGSSPTYGIRRQGAATVDGSGVVRISAATGDPGENAFCFIHNYDDNPATTSIYGGAAVATRVNE